MILGSVLSWTYDGSPINVADPTIALHGSFGKRPSHALAECYFQELAKEGKTALHY